MRSHRAMQGRNSQQPRRRWLRNSVAVVAILCCVYLVLFVRGLLFEAQMSLGIIRRNEQGLRAQIVNKESYAPPTDSLLRPSQIMVLHEISRHLDSLSTAKAQQREIDQQLVRMLNRFTMSVSEYRWIRQTATRLMSGRRPLRGLLTDSANTSRLHMIMGDVTTFRRFYRDTLDRELL
ncbi:MAG: hypothetical protein FGM32_01820 [Candidatus Kapabacteria bacterium]|nr:hypothetical protein [Candidatus Kapabacteria bacterium]